MKTIHIAAMTVLSLGVALAACGDDDPTTPPATTGTASASGGSGATGGTGGNGAAGATGGAGGGGVSKPALSPDQIDRKGRPAINTVGAHAFTKPNSGSAGGAGGGAADGHDLDQDAYNQDADSSTWAASYTAALKESLGILDSLDGTCGNQIAYGAAGLAGYGALGTVLANDWLLVNAAGTLGAQYLGVEVNAITLASQGGGAGGAGGGGGAGGAAAAPDLFKGGRKPAADIIDTTYSALAAGIITGVDDGITAPANVTAAEAMFPYLPAPN